MKLSACGYMEMMRILNQIGYMIDGDIYDRPVSSNYLRVAYENIADDLHKKDNNSNPDIVIEVIRCIQYAMIHAIIFMNEDAIENYVKGLATLANLQERTEDREKLFETWTTKKRNER